MYILAELKARQERLTRAELREHDVWCLVQRLESELQRARDDHRKAEFTLATERFLVTVATSIVEQAA
jgi:hypothetical protein